MLMILQSLLIRKKCGAQLGRVGLVNLVISILLIHVRMDHWVCAVLSVFSQPAGLPSFPVSALSDFQ